MLSTKNKKQELPKKRSHWSAEEDTAIISVVSSMSSESWGDICRQLKGHHSLKSRTGKQCRERWSNHLDPTVTKSKWTNEEMLLLFNTHSQIGNKWSKIKESIPQRSENSIKNRYYSSLRKQFRLWKGYEPQIEHIHKHGPKLATQILTSLRKKANKKSSPKTLADIDPIQELSAEEEIDKFIEFFPIF